MLLAERLDAEIVSVDSMQIYRGMDIGTAKPSLEERQRVRHHMIDLVDPTETFTVARFQRRGREALSDIAERGRTCLIVGGSGLHHRALVDPMTFPPTDDAVRERLEALSAPEAVTRLVEADPRAADHVDLANPRRVVRALEIVELTGVTPSERAKSEEAGRLRDYDSEIEHLAFGFDPGEGLAQRVEERFDSMLEAGFVDEVEALELGPATRTAVGYRQIRKHLRGDATLEEARQAAIEATRSLARRQRTFFRRDPRIRWLPWEDDVAARAAAVIAAIEEA